MEPTVAPQDQHAASSIAGGTRRLLCSAVSLCLLTLGNAALAQDPTSPYAPEAPSGEQLLERELNDPSGPMRVRRAEPVDPNFRRVVPLDPPDEPAVQAETLDPAPPSEQPIPRALPVERPSAPVALDPPESRRAEPVVRRAEPVPGSPAEAAPSGVPPAAVPRRAEPVAASTAPPPAPDPAPVAAPVATPVPPPEAAAATPSAAPAVAQATPPEPQATPAPAPAPVSTNPAADQLAVADGFYARQMWDVALTQYARYLNDYPRDSGRQTALYRAGEAALRQEKMREARIFYDTLLKEFKTGPFVGPAAYRMADFHYKDENYSPSARLFAQAADLLKEPNLVLSSRYFEARSLEKLGRRSEAARAYQLVADSQDDSPYREIALLSFARIQVESGEKEKALANFEKLLQTSAKPEIRSEATVQAGLLAAELGKTDKAVEFLNRAIEDSSQAQWRPQAALVLMRVLSAADRSEEVVDAFRKYGPIISATERPEMLVVAAKAYRRLGDYDRSTRILQEVFENHPQSTQASEAEYQYLLGLYQAKEDGLADRVDRFLAKNPRGPQADRAALLKAEYLFTKGEYPAAAEAYQRVVESDLPKEIKAEGIYRQAWCLWETKDLAQGVLKFNQFIGNYPDHPLVPKALAQRGLAYTQTKQFDLALADFNRIINHFKDAAAERELAIQKKALILGQQGDNKGMVATFRQLLAEYPETSAKPQAYWWIGQGTYNEKEYKESIEAMRQARELDAAQYDERASIYIMLSLYALEDLDALADEVTRFTQTERQLRVPDDVLMWMGRKYFVDEKFGPAEQFLTLVVDSPTFDTTSDGALFLGRARAKNGKHEKAIEAFDKHLEHHSIPADRARTLLEKAASLIALNDYDSAVRAAEDALNLQPDGRLNAEARLLLGDVEMARKKFEEAAKAYYGVSVLYDDPEITPLALGKAASAYEKAGQTSRATELRSELKRRYPTPGQ